jgi:hypothetical protein
MKTKRVGKPEGAKTPEEYHALGAQLDREASVLGPARRRGFVVKFRTWEELERWETRRLIETGKQMRCQ